MAIGKLWDLVAPRAENLWRGTLSPRIFFLHVPKCGGTTLSQAMVAAYPLTDYLRGRVVTLDAAASARAAQFAPSMEGSVFRMRETLLHYWMSQQRVRHIDGHFPFSNVAHDRFGDRFAFVTMLRDPVQRYLSEYFYNRYKSHTAHRRDEASMPLEQYVDTPFGQQQGMQYARFISGQETICDEPEAIEQAQANLQKMKLVGCLEQQDIFLARFAKLFGRKLTLRRRNVSPVSESQRREQVNDAVLQRIADVCRADAEIYRFAVERLVQPA